jgi:hypothetical protein
MTHGAGASGVGVGGSMDVEKAIAEIGDGLGGPLLKAKLRLLVRQVVAECVAECVAEREREMALHVVAGLADYPAEALFHEAMAAGASNCAERIRHKFPI